MPKYEVRLEFNVISTDFAMVEVEADSPEQARIAATELYYSDDCPDLDYWASDYIDTSLDTTYQSDWEVEQL